jgi:hypothetical protein
MVIEGVYYYSPKIVQFVVMELLVFFFFFLLFRFIADVREELFQLGINLFSCSVTSFLLTA